MLLVLAEMFIARDIPQNGELAFLLLLLLLLLLLEHLSDQVQMKFTRYSIVPRSRTVTK